MKVFTFYVRLAAKMKQTTAAWKTASQPCGPGVTCCDKGEVGVADGAGDEEGNDSPCAGARSVSLWTLTLG